MKPVIDYGFADGMWSIVDVVSHLEAAIAQHPDPAARKQMHAEYKQLEASLLQGFLPMLRDFDHAVEDALKDT